MHFLDNYYYIPLNIYAKLNFGSISMALVKSIMASYNFPNLINKFPNKCDKI